MMKMNSFHFLFPNDPLNPTQVEPLLLDQYLALIKAGFTVTVQEIPGKSFSSSTPVIYRGWMLSKTEYTNLVEKSSGKMFISIDEYFAAHYLPNWYPLIEDLTPETVIYPETVDIVVELEKLNWGSYFIKDYVKSTLKSLINKTSDAPSAIAEMLDYRGEIEGGICVRRVEKYIPESERRYFVFENKVHGMDKIPKIAFDVAERIPSKFYSIDIAQRTDGVFRVIEIGDGQVSDLKEWTPEKFAEIFKT